MPGLPSKCIGLGSLLGVNHEDTSQYEGTSFVSDCLLAF